MDPFTGLGSTAVACSRLGVNFIGAEIDDTYLAVAVERARVAAGERNPQKLLGVPGRGEAPMRKATLRKRDDPAYCAVDDVALKT